MKTQKYLPTIFLSVLLVFLLPTMAFAATDTKYIDMNAGHLINNNSQFLKEALQNPLAGGSTYNGSLPSAGTVSQVWHVWDELALSLFDSGYNYTKEISPGITRSPLTQAARLSDIPQKSWEWFAAQGVSGVSRPDFFTESQLAAGDKQAYYFNRLIYSQTPSMGIFGQGLSRRKLITVVFYDFQLKPLQDEEVAKEISDNLYNAIVERTNEGKSYSTVTKYLGPSGTAESTQEISNTLGASVSLASSQTSGYEFSTSVESTTKISASTPVGVGVEQSFTLGFSASSMFSSTVGQTLGETNESTHATSTTVICPPQTAAVLTADTFSGTKVIEYNYPVAVEYKVQMICRHHWETQQWTTVYNFSDSGIVGQSGNAINSLMTRYYNNNVSGHEDQYKGPGDGPINPVNWKTVLGEITTPNRWKIADIINRLDNSRPYNDAGGSLSVATEGVSNAIYTYPIFPLKHVQALSPFDSDYNIGSGETFYLDAINLEGLNENFVPYYGFNSKFGHWALLDANGNDISDAGNSIAALKRNPISGRISLQAGNNGGVVYLKYNIEESRYNYYAGDHNPHTLNSFAKNSDLDSTAVIQVNVSQTTIPVSEVKLMPKTLLINQGQTWQLFAEILPDNASGKAVTYTSSNTDTVSVTASGNIAALRPGLATITCTSTDGRKADTCVVRVLDDKGSAIIEAHSDTILDKPGNITIPLNKEARMTLLSGAEIMLPGNSTVDGSGNVTIGAATQVSIPEKTPISIPKGSIIGSDGSITVGQGGASVVGSSITLNIAAGSLIILDAGMPLGYYISDDNPFADVAAGNWFFDNTMFAYSHGLMNGTGTEPMTFSPNSPLTRGMLVTILYRMAGSPSVVGLANPYSDVAGGKWYTNAVIWANANTIASGIGENKFAPDNNITREQMAVMMYNYAATLKVSLPQQRTDTFTDSEKISTWALTAVNAMYAAEILNGKGEQNFDPKGNASRAEIATMLMNFIRVMK